LYVDDRLEGNAPETVEAVFGNSWISRARKPGI
jgi:hypothetical protein